MTNSTHDKIFNALMTNNIEVSVKRHVTLLDEALLWISENLNPDDIFTDNILGKWAESNGYIKE